ncbi:MAG: creatininase family protein, partial [Candidatus Marinimicrobia bacterium]|nr:creatininase family protein [Candidatus Neomarinimicrobiota bacterium]
PSETSQMMYHFSEHVKPVDVEFKEMKRSEYFADKNTFRKLYPNGVMGADVNMATKEHGEQLYMKCVSSISEEINQWEKA